MANKTAIEFGKAQVSSVISTACDFCTTAVLYELLRHVVASTAGGAIVGGIVNCVINYRWTFQGTSRTKRGVFWRYAMVWIGSVVLNTVGTEYGVKLLDLWLSQNLGSVLLVKAVIAILVAVFWNFTLQKYYVYKK